MARDYDPDLGYTPCRWCGAPATTADHWPVSRVDGGPDTLDNLVAACVPCNCGRGATMGNLRRNTAPPSRRW
jgi:HNH endonuclease